jgi:allantoin racemase
MHEAHAYLAERLPVPIINPGPLTYRLADAAIKLKLAHSRASYPSPSRVAAERLAEMGKIAAGL